MVVLFCDHWFLFSCVGCCNVCFFLMVEWWWCGGCLVFCDHCFLFSCVGPGVIMVFSFHAWVSFVGSHFSGGGGYPGLGPVIFTCTLTHPIIV